MNEEKKVPFKWEYGEETISLQLGMYANNQRLYIGMITHTEDGAEAFADMTVNLPGYSLDPGEAFISGDISKDLLRFIKENKLGKVLPYQVQSGYGKYSAVAFDLEKLKAFDPKGVAEFRKEWNLPDKKPVKKKSRGWSDEKIPPPAAGGPALERNAPPLHILWKGGDENAGRSGKQDFNAGCQWNKVHRQAAQSRHQQVHGPLQGKEAAKAEKP